MPSLHTHPIPCRGSEALTAGVRICVQPAYLPDQSAPAAGRYVFSYQIRISNETHSRIQLISRYWKIIDADGDLKEVNAEGVVGKQPFLDLGQSFEYSSYCPLETPWGTMEGSYTFKTADGESLVVAINRFYLIAPGA